MTPEDEAMLEALTSAQRETGAFGEIRFHPYFFDLGAEGRVEAARRTLVQRALEAALDRDGLSTTARAVLSRISSARR
jgi:hypothetical protein